MYNEIEFYKLLESFKDTKRYGEYDQRFHESSAEHTCLLSLLVIDISKNYNIDIDLRHALEIAAVHDIPEIGLDFDFDAKKCSTNNELKAKKIDYESKILGLISSRYERSYIQDLCNEYINASSNEVLFVKALDKLETVMHIFYKGSIHLTDIDFAISNFEKYIKTFPQLVPLLNAIKEYKSNFLNTK